METENYQNLNQIDFKWLEERARRQRERVDGLVRECPKRDILTNA